MYTLKGKKDMNMRQTLFDNLSKVLIKCHLILIVVHNNPFDLYVPTCRYIDFSKNLCTNASTTINK